MSKIVRQTLREQVANEIRMKILTGELREKTKIVEQDIAEELGVSRAPVREALRQLEQEGVVEYTSHVGCTVKKFTAHDVYEVYLLRANLEILSIKMCEGHFSQETLEKMEGIVAKMRDVDTIERFDETIDNDNAFHECIINESKMERLHTLWDGMSNENTIVFYRGVGKRDYVIHNQERIHKRVLDALKTGDVDHMCRVLGEHYMETIKSYLFDHGIDPASFPYKMNIQF